MSRIKMIFGSPGCGKTTALMNILEDLLHTYKPEEIAFVSFTRKGTYEGRDRAIERFNYKEKDFPYFRTIHSIAFTEMGYSRYDMISKKDYKEFSKAMGMNFLGFYTEDLPGGDDKYLFAISMEVNNPKKFVPMLEELEFKKYGYVKRNYIRFKHQKGIVDFNDIIIDYIKNGEPLPVKVAIVDEAQDLTSLQWKFLRKAFKRAETIFIAGDDDQAIYEWSGADVEKFLSIAKETTDITILEKSFRLPEEILNHSKKIVHQISNRVDKDFHPSGAEGKVFFHNSVKEIVLNSEQSYYFLSRNRSFLKGIASELEDMGVDFTHKGENRLDKSLYKDIVRYEHLRKDSPSDIKRDRSLTLRLKKGIKGTPVWYEAFNLSEEDEQYYRSVFRSKCNPQEESNIVLSTIHGVKGGEADNVVLLLDISKKVYQSLTTNTDAELRCLYVACTRAKKNLHIVHSNSKYGYEV